MATSCTDPRSGALLHAYELGILSEEDTQRFEAHLIVCDSCFEEVKRFTARSDLLRTDVEVRRALAKAGGWDHERQPAVRRIWRHLWPDAPLAFKPAIVYLLALLLIYPAYLGLRSDDTAIRNVQSISLVPTRSVTSDGGTASARTDVVLAFYFDGATAGEPYVVEISDSTGAVVTRNEAFRDFDNLSLGRLFVPAGRLQPGAYTLTIRDHSDTTALERQEYIFRLAP